MNGKKNLFLLLILVVLSSAYYLYDVKWAKEVQKKKEISLKLIGSNETSNLERLSFYGKNNKYVLKRNGKGFSIIKPIVASVDEDVLDKMLKVVAQIKEQRRIGKVDSLKEFGLSDTKQLLSMNFKNSKDIVLKLGNKNPTKKFRYVLLGNGEVATVDIAVLKKFDKKIFDIRDKYLITTIPADANKVSAFSRGMKKIFDATRNEKNKDKWNLIYPLNEESDAVETEGVVSTLRWDQVARFVEEDPKDLSKYGLDNPKYIYHVFKDRASKKPDDGVIVGEREISFAPLNAKDPKAKKNKEILFYARRLSGGPVFLMKEHTMNNLPKDTFKIRKKTLIDYDVDHVTRIRFSWDGNTFDSIRKSKKEWDVSVESSAGTRTVKFKGRHKHIDDLLWDIKWSNSAGYIDNPKKNLSDYGLESKDVRKFDVYIKKKKEDKETLHTFIISKLLDGKKAYGKFVGQERIFMLKKKDYEKITRRTKYFRDRRLIVFDSIEKIQKLIVAYPDGKKMILRRPLAGLFGGTDKNSWEFTNLKEKKVNVAEVDGFLNRLKDLEYEESDIGKNEYDFDNYRMTVTLYGKNENKLRTIIFAKSKNKDYLIARRGFSKTEVLPVKRRYNESRFPKTIKDWIKE